MDDWKLQPARDHGLSPMKRQRSLERESGLVSSALHIAWWSFVRAYMGIWHRLLITGRQHLPKEPPYILVGNHTSHLDALVLAAPLPWRQRDRIFPIAAGDVFFETPVMSAFAAGMLNALPMWRKKCGPHALEQLRQRMLEEPCAYILFPEGKRSRDGSLLDFKPGLGMLVAGTSVPVVPCYLDGCIAALPAETRWPRFKPIRLTIGEPISFADVANDRGGWKHIAATTRERVAAMAPG